MSSNVYQTIKATRDLPSPTGVALHILELAHNENTRIEEIASAVRSDPAITSRLLKLVNSPLAGMPRQVASVQRAVALLGIRTVTGLALGFSLVSDNRHGKCKAFDYELFWSESVARAVAAGHIALRLKNFAPDEAFTCGLLCQIGRLALATAFPEDYAEVLNSVTSDKPDKLTMIEKTRLGIDHNELAAEMMADWHMPVLFREAVRAQEAPGAGLLEAGSRAYDFATILHLTRSIALVLTQPVVYRDTLSALAQEANRLGIDAYLCHEMLDAISEQWRDAGPTFSVRTRRVPPLAEIYSQARDRRQTLANDNTMDAPEVTGEVASATS